jgi:hypothetical protein
MGHMWSCYEIKTKLIELKDKIKNASHSITKKKVKNVEKLSNKENK